MDLADTPEQAELKAQAERVLRDLTGSGNKGQSLWPVFADLGWLAIPFSGAIGGLDLGAIETAIIAEQSGRFLVVEPFISRVVLAGGMIRRLAAPNRQPTLLSPLIAGRRQIALAHEDAGPQARRQTTRAISSATGWQLTGRKIAVPDAASADDLVITADLDDGTLGLFLLAPTTPGLTFEHFATVDGRTAAHITLGAVAIDADARLNRQCARAALDDSLDDAIAATCADLVGAMQGALDATVAYCKLRVQFGQPIAANQVVKHRLVDMAVQLEEARSLTLGAIVRLGDGSPVALRQRAVSAAKIKVSAAGRFVTEQAVQLHGAMGVTDELDIGAYLKKSVAFDAQFGSKADHLARYRRLG